MRPLAELLTVEGRREALDGLLQALVLWLFSKLAFLQVPAAAATAGDTSGPLLQPYSPPCSH
jgi:hypothetical protein